MTEEPKYVHDCPNCVFVCHLRSATGDKDVYYHPKNKVHAWASPQGPPHEPMVVIRGGSWGGEAFHIGMGRVSIPVYAFSKSVSTTVGDYKKVYAALLKAGHVDKRLAALAVWAVSQGWDYHRCRKAGLTDEWVVLHCR